MDESYNFRPEVTQTRKGSWRLWLALALFAFGLGAAFTYMLARNAPAGSALSALFDLRRTDAALADNPSPIPSTSETTATVAQARAAVRQVQQVAEQQGGLDARLAAMEQRLTRLDLQAQAAAGNAARAEGLLIAFATRRAIERGDPLGYLADQLQLRFGDAAPAEVRTIIAAAADPVTVDQLLARLDALAPELAAAPADEGLFSRIGRELSAAFVVRREDTPAPATERRLERARLFLQSGRPDDALIEVRNLPNAAVAREWIADAQRHAGAHAALETIETAAVMDERALRDREGAPVE